MSRNIQIPFTLSELVDVFTLSVYNNKKMLLFLLMPIIVTIWKKRDKIRKKISDAFCVVVKSDIFYLVTT